mmetsp:Transcript_48827/g.116089  ORF Transcript_48827/g.116089 Transcript_48827/m.116089 type:complete len:319 (-) Transcript_48827:59-1015(-)
MGGAFGLAKGIHHFADVVGDPRTGAFIGRWAVIGGACSVVFTVLAPRLSQLLATFIIGAACSSIYAFKFCLDSQEDLKSTSSSSSLPRWRVITQDSDFLPQTATFSSQAEAETFFKAVGDERPCIVLSPSKEVLMENARGSELQHEDLLAKFSANVVEAVVPGKWMVLQEVSPYNVSFHAFEDQEHAEDLFHSVTTTRLLLNPEQEEVKKSGMNLWGLDTLRSQADTHQVQGLLPGKWMVLTDEGVNRAGYHAFEDQEQALAFFKKFGMGKTRLLLNPDMAVVQRAGVNLMARRFLSRAASRSTVTATSSQPVETKED